MRFLVRSAELVAVAPKYLCPAELSQTGLPSQFEILFLRRKLITTWKYHSLFYFGDHFISCFMIELARITNILHQSCTNSPVGGPSITKNYFKGNLKFSYMKKPVGEAFYAQKPPSWWNFSIVANFHTSRSCSHTAGIKPHTFFLGLNFHQIDRNEKHKQESF